MSFNAAAVRNFAIGPGFNAAEHESNVASIIGQRAQNEALKQDISAANRKQQAMELLSAGRADEARRIAPAAVQAYEQNQAAIQGQNLSNEAAQRKMSQGDNDAFGRIVDGYIAAESRKKGAGRQFLEMPANRRVMDRVGVEADLSQYSDEDIMAAAADWKQRSLVHGTPRQAAKPTADIQNYEYMMGLSPDQQAAFSNQLTTPATQININDKADMKGQEDIAEKRAAQLIAIEEKADSAYHDLSLADQFEQAQMKVRSGVGAEAISDMKSLLETIGVDVETLGLTDNMAEADVMHQLNLEFAARYMANTKGAISDREFAAFRSAAPGLMNTPGGNALLIHGIRKAAQRDIDIDKLAQEYVGEHGSLYAGPGWRKQLNAWRDDNPVFTDKELADIQKMSKGEIEPYEATSGWSKLGHGDQIRIKNAWPGQSNAWRESMMESLNADN